jgi:hypothetical protein
MGCGLLYLHSMHHCTALHAFSCDPVLLLLLLLRCVTQPSFSAEKAIPMGAAGVLITCDAGRDRKAAAEMTSLFEEVGVPHLTAAKAAGSSAHARADQLEVQPQA